MPDYLQAFILLSTIFPLALISGFYLYYRRWRFVPNKAYFHLGQGVEKIRANDLQGAEAELNEAIRLNTNLHDAYFHRAFIYTAQSKFDEALADFTRTIELDPHSAKNYILRGDIYMRKGEYAKAKSDASRAFAFPTSKAERMDAFIMRGYCNLSLASSNAYQADVKNTQSIADAISDFSEALNLNLLNVAALSGRGQAYQLLGKLEDAIQDLSKSIEVDPTKAFTYELRGNSYRQIKDYEKAEADYEKLMALEPQYSSAMFANIGAVRHLKGDIEGAFAACNRAIELDSQSPFNFYTRGLIYIHQQAWESAIQDFTRAIELKHPKLSNAYLNRGIAFSKQDKLAEALKDYTEAISINPDLALAFNNRGYLYSLAGEYEKALDDCSQAIRLNASLVYSYGSRGHTYFLMGRYPNALADFQKATEIKPDHKFAIAGEAISQNALGKPEEAKRLWESLITLDSEYQNADKLKAEFQCAEAFLEEAQKVAAL